MLLPCCDCCSCPTWIPWSIVGLFLVSKDDVGVVEREPPLIRSNTPVIINVSFRIYSIYDWNIAKTQISLIWYKKRNTIYFHSQFQIKEYAFKKILYNNAKEISRGCFNEDKVHHLLLLLLLFSYTHEHKWSKIQICMCKKYHAPIPQNALNIKEQFIESHINSYRVIKSCVELCIDNHWKKYFLNSSKNIKVLKKYKFYEIYILLNLRTFIMSIPYQDA